MTTALLACWLMVQEDAAARIASSPPLPVLVEAGPGETLLEERWKSLAKAWGESWSRAYAERALVQPLDGHGRAGKTPRPWSRPSHRAWDSGLASISRFSVTGAGLHRYVYEPLTGIETRAEERSGGTASRPASICILPGIFRCWERMTRARIATVSRIRSSVRRTESCLVLGQSVIVANHDDKTFLKHQDPPQMPPGLGFPAISPFRDFDPADRARIFEISSGSQHAAGQRLHPEIPRTLGRLARSHYGRVEVLLDPKTGTPRGDESCRLAGGPDSLCL